MLEDVDLRGKEINPDVGSSQGARPAQVTQPWIRYETPRYSARQRSKVICFYEVHEGETNVQIGYVEKYVDALGRERWRAITHRWDDFSQDHSAREHAARDLLLRSSVARARVNLLRPDNTLSFPEEGGAGKLAARRRQGVGDAKQAEESGAMSYAVVWSNGQGQVMIGHPGTFGETPEEAKDEGRKILADASIDPSVRLKLMPLATVETDKELEDRILEECEEIEVGDELLFYDVTSLNTWSSQSWWPRG